MKLAKASKRFCKSIEVESTRKLYDYSLRSLLDELGDKKLEQISPDDLQDWRSQLDRAVSASTRNRGKKLGQTHTR